MMAIDFGRMRGRQDLAAYLECSGEAADFLADASADDVFTKHRIPKRGRPGKFREVWEVSERATADLFKNLARTLRAFLVDHLPGFPHPAAHGYVRGRSTLTNASKHLGAPCVVKADIRDFFRTINADMVVKMLTRSGLRDDAANAMAAVLVWDNHTPLGLHTSPLLANAICVELDDRLSRLVPGGMYTRYADDLSFSGPKLPSRKVVEAELALAGFRLADEKWCVVRRGRGLWVTGLSLEDGIRPRVPKGIKRRLRQDLHYVAKYGIDAHAGRRGYGSRQSALNKIHGTIQYLRGIEQDIGRKLHRKWVAILAKEGMNAALVSTSPDQGRQALFLVDESVLDVPGGQKLVLGLAIVEDLQQVRRALDGLCSDLLARPHPATDIDRLEKEGLHWNALGPEDRTRAVEKLIELPYRGFVAYATLSSGDKNTYSATYERVLSKLLDKRLVRYAGVTVELIAEENNKISSALLGRVMSNAYDRLGKAGDRRPSSLPTCSVAPKKSDHALPLPDLMLAIVGEYARVEIQRNQAQKKRKGEKKQKRLPGEQAVRRYRQTEGKIHAVFDLDGARVFSRRYPFKPWNP